MATEEQDKKRGFKVTDRRRFAGEGSGADPEEPEETVESGAAAAGKGEAASKPQTEEAPGARDSSARPPRREISFSTFIMGLSTQTLMSLGEIASPVDGQKKQDLEAAKELIDLLGILRDKTAGNLDGSEQELLDGMLYDLRMRYVEVSRER